MLETGDRAPEFTLSGVDGAGNEKEFSLKEFTGKKVVLYFYPKDNTPGCTTEACDFRDNMNRLVSAGFNVIGVSPDSIKSHLKFQKDHGLVFTLLSDPDKSVASIYGAYGEKVMYGKKTMGIIRSTFLIGEDGLIKKIWRNVKAKGHVDSVLKSI